MAQRCVAAPFLIKTYQLVDDLSINDIISWNDTGTTFIVWKPADFAKDLLPKYFKHNNFSSFVRQLNTYGFRKAVPDRWEFSNESFKRGEKDLLCKIHRRKGIPTPLHVGKSSANGNNGEGISTPANSGEDMGSTATSSHGHWLKNHASDENEKLRKDNQLLSVELAQTKKQCEELMVFLSRYVKVGPEQINRIMSQGSVGPSYDPSVEICRDDDENLEEEEEVKLFGVCLRTKGERGAGTNKRRRGPEARAVDVSGPPSMKEMKVARDFEAPWMRISSSPAETSKVCN
ncbi:hypothetical protein NE237_023961 [Protea cynaroides]|uniref:HSF-type DNA-binding domain-containing protein n=1 Tax=Protea cynaroides TaxID=273540 RepID=A0A9Q0K5W7_9MAGN|nr:hypothetical protein NE237_023961 [Protea cynaroides]